MRINRLRLFKNLVKDFSSDVQESLYELNSLHTKSLYETRNNTKYIKNDLLNRFISQNGIDFRETEIHSLEDMAVIAKMFRDTRYETTRIFFIRDNKVVGTEGVTSKIPDASTVIPSYDVKNPVGKAFAVYKAKMDRLHADGYYLIHNHPSGNSSPSRSDFNVTFTFMKELEGFLGHFIIGKDNYSVIDNNLNSTKYYYMDELPKENIITILNNDDAFSYAKEYLNDKNYSVILYCNSKGQLASIQEIKNTELNDKNIGNYIANEKRENGSVICVLCTLDSSIVDNQNINDALFRQILNDAVIINGHNIHSMKELTNMDVDDMYNSLGKKKVNSFKVSEN